MSQVLQSSIKVQWHSFNKRYAVSKNNALRGRHGRVEPKGEEMRLSMSPFPKLLETREALTIRDRKL